MYMCVCMFFMHVFICMLDRFFLCVYNKNVWAQSMPVRRPVKQGQRTGKRPRCVIVWDTEVGNLSFRTTVYVTIVIFGEGKGHHRSQSSLRFSSRRKDMSVVAVAVFPIPYRQAETVACCKWTSRSLPEVVWQQKICKCEESRLDSFERSRGDHQVFVSRYSFIDRKREKE